MSSPDKRPAPAESDQNGTKKIKSDEMDPHVFTGFVVDEILNENSQNKVAFIKGHYTDKEGDAVVIVEKPPFNKNTIEGVLTGDSDTACTLKNDIYSTLELCPPRKFSEIKTTLIYPATEKHIGKYRTQEFFFLNETSEDYKTITLPYLESEQFSIQWVYNILEKKKEADRIVYEDPDPDTGFILLPDMKWDRKQVEDLYLVCIVQKRGIKSLRDLTADHLALLRNIRDKGEEAIMKQFSVPASKLRVYLHYQPSYYHLHVHFTHLKFQAPGSGVERAHLLQDVIDNLENYPDYYQKKTLSFTARQTDKLYQKFVESGKA